MIFMCISFRVKKRLRFYYRYKRGRLWGVEPLCRAVSGPWHVLPFAAPQTSLPQLIEGKSNQANNKNTVLNKGFLVPPHPCHLPSLLNPSLSFSPLLLLFLPSPLPLPPIVSLPLILLLFLFLSPYPFLCLNPYISLSSLSSLFLSPLSSLCLPPFFLLSLVVNTTCSGKLKREF